MIMTSTTAATTTSTMITTGVLTETSPILAERQFSIGIEEPDSVGAAPPSRIDQLPPRWFFAPDGEGQVVCKEDWTSCVVVDCFGLRTLPGGVGFVPRTYEDLRQEDVELFLRLRGAHVEAVGRT